MEYVIYTSLEEAKENGKENVREDVYQLWQNCFGDTEAYTDFYFQWVVPYNRIFTLYKEDKLCSMLHLNSYTLVLKGREVKADYIVGVATRQDERKKGYMGLLIDRAFQCMYEEEKPLTYLMPAADAIYYPYDFRKVYLIRKWVAEMKETAQPLSSWNTGSKMVELTTSDSNNRKLLAEFTERILKENYDIYAIRSRKYYEKLLEEMCSTGGGISLIFKGDTIIGYAAYMLDDGFNLAECIYEPVYKKEVLTELYRKFSPYLKEKNTGFEPSIMVRIINLKAFLNCLNANKDIHLVIEAVDERIADNNGVFCIVVEKDKTWVTKTTTELPMIKGDIAALAMLFFGKLKEEEIMELILSEDKENILDVLKELRLGEQIFINEIV